MKRPLRPLGVSLAIFVSTLIFSILPLLQVGLLVSVRDHFMSVQMPDELSAPAAMGGNYLGIDDGTVLLQGVIAIAFLGVAFAAWRGRPSSMRIIVIVVVIGLTVLKLVTVIAQRMSDQHIQLGISSLNSISEALSPGELVLDFLVMVYVVWYMNRGPARAFYRGYFLPNPDEAAVDEAPV